MTALLFFGPTLHFVQDPQTGDRSVQEYGSIQKQLTVRSRTVSKEPTGIRLQGICNISHWVQICFVASKQRTHVKGF